MRNFPQAFLDHLATGATTLCRCWKLIRRDGMSFGFTDHDQDIVFNGVTFAASSGLEGAELETKLGLSVGGSEIVGALTTPALTELTVSGGSWDNATVETWYVNWADPTIRVLLDIGQIGEIRCEDNNFTAEIRGLAQRFDEERGRIYQTACNADLGDARCGIAIDGALYRSAGTVTATDSRLTLTATLAGSYATGWFDAGSIAFNSGQNAGTVIEIRQHSLQGATIKFVLWRRTSAAIAVGDAITVKAGCDKRIDTCRGKFANALNFRGFPSIPTNDFILTYARQGDSSQDGTVLPS